MSERNVELVVGLYPAPDVDFAQLVRDESRWTAWTGTNAPFFHPEAESVRPGLPNGKTYAGLDGFRDMWLEWLAPWKTYRVEAEEVIGLPPLSRTLERLGRKTRQGGSSAQIEAAVPTGVPS